MNNLVNPDPDPPGFWYFLESREVSVDCDSDFDGVKDSLDEFPFNPLEAFDGDDDSDGVKDSDDAFPLDASESLDTDGDGTGNNADTDDDGDGLSDAEEASLGTDPLLTDTDSDGSADNLDAFPTDATETLDTDSDGIGNNADTDDDGDGLADGAEGTAGTNPLVADTDADGSVDGIDAFPLEASETLDTDSDGVGNNADTDDDGDGFSDEQEAIDGTNPLSRFSCRSGCFSFDVDQSSSLNALTDGLLVMRHLFDFSGDTLVANATDTSATRSSASDISSYLTDAQTELDIDGNGEVGALTDGLLLIRYLFDFRGESLISNAVDANATRKTAAEIEAYIEARVPGS